jgi:hypothetical protein
MSTQPNNVIPFPKLLSRHNYHGWEILEYDVLGKRHFEASNGENCIILKNYDQVVEMIDAHSNPVKQVA